MTEPTAASGATNSGSGATSLGSALRDLTSTTFRYAMAKASRKVEDWSDDLNSVVGNGGPTMMAALQGLNAALQGKNPVWAALKGAWSGASLKLKLAVVLTLLLMLLLSPVVIVVLALGLLVAAIVAGIRSATR